MFRAPQHAAGDSDPVRYVQAQYALKTGGCNARNMRMHLRQTGHQIPVRAVDDNRAGRPVGLQIDISPLPFHAYFVILEIARFQQVA